MRNWRDIHYLLQDNHHHHAAYHALRDIQVFERLLIFDPVLVGTIPLNLDIPESDLDIILHAQDYQEVAQIIRKHYLHYDGFRDRFRHEAYIANFQAHDFEIELFAQDIPTTKQNAYRHMLIEYRILEIAGNGARQAIRELKQNGFKTEPAFAKYFSLKGDPYQTLLELEQLDDVSLKKRLNL